MNFKHLFGAALTVMCALVMTTTLTACGGDDDNDSKGGGDNHKPVAASLNATLTAGDDLMKYFDLTVDYYDANGKLQSESLKEAKWEKTIKASLPATLGVCLKAQLKDGVDPATIDLLSVNPRFLMTTKFWMPTTEELTDLLFPMEDLIAFMALIFPNGSKMKAKRSRRFFTTSMPAASTRKAVGNT